MKTPTNNKKTLQVYIVTLHTFTVLSEMNVNGDMRNTPRKKQRLDATHARAVLTMFSHDTSRGVV